MKYAKLRGKIVEKFRTLSAFAEAMGKTKGTITQKMNGRSQWTAEEIAKACEILEIPLSEVHSYFFCGNGCENATK